jgi:hypothetical protein
MDSALGEFECAYANYVATVGILSEEYIVSAFWLNSNIWGWRGDEINTAPGSCPTTRDASGFGAYTPLQSARYMAEDGARRIESFPDAQVPQKANLLAHLTTYGAYSYTLLGEGFCNMAIDQGPLLTREQIFQTAEQRFTTAITLAESAANTNLRDLALLGRARVRLSLNKTAEAAADAERIPEGFVWNAEFSESRPRRENRVFNVTHRNAFLSVAPAYRNLQIGDVPDTRVPVVNSGRAGHDAVTPHWLQMKFPSATTPIRLGSWQEAQLIVAEARGGQEARNAINRIRARAGLPQLTGAEQEPVLNLVLEERRRELFSEGHRFNDMLRHQIPFPSGRNHKGQDYGSITCIPLPDQERLNNPNL